MCSYTDPNNTLKLKKNLRRNILLYSLEKQLNICLPESYKSLHCNFDRDHFILLISIYAICKHVCMYAHTMHAYFEMERYKQIHMSSSP